MSTLCQCLFKTGGQYLPAFALWKPFSGRLSAVCIASHDGGESAAACVHRFLFPSGKNWWHFSNWILHHDNAPAHRAVTTNEFLAKHNIPSLSHPPYSPDLALCNFFIFLQLKKTMKGRRFNYIEAIQANATRQLRAIT